MRQEQLLKSSQPAELQFANYPQLADLER
jgi:hypothetical protein